MSDIDEGDREGDRAYTGRPDDPNLNVREFIRDARESLAFRSRVDHGPTTEAVVSLVHGVENLYKLVLAQQVAIDGLRETLQTYMRRSAPALSAARMHVPIGGGDSFWRAQQRRKQEERAAEAKRHLEELKPQVIAELTELFDLDAVDRLVEMPDGTMRETPPKRVQRKRSRKTSRRK